MRDKKSVGITGSVDKKLSLKFQRSQNEESNGQRKTESGRCVPVCLQFLCLLNGGDDSSVTSIKLDHAF